MESSLEITRPPFLPREFRGYSLNAACRLEASCRGFLLRILHANSFSRQTFFLFAAKVDLDQPKVFLAQLAERAPDVLVGLEHLDPHAQIARALILMKPRRTIEALFGSCPDGFLGLLARLGGDPQYGKETYRTAFNLFADPRNGRRAKVLGQLEGQLRAEHVVLAAGLDEALLHPAVLRRSKPAEIPALNVFVAMITDLCDATPELIKESLDALPAIVKGVKISEWAESWMRRQVRLSVPFAVPCDDPDLRLRLGAEQISLGRRFRNCAASRMSYAFLNERVLVEWIRPGEEAVIELAAIQSGSERRWEVTQLLGPRNRRAKTAVVAAIRERLDGLGILYQSSPFPSAEQDGLHALLEHFPNAPFPDYLAQRADDAEDEDADIEQMLAELEQEVHGQEAA